VSGNSRMARGEVLALLDGLRGASMVTADLERSRLKLLGAPWVADAAIRRVFPDTVSVVISEREPMGIGRIGDSLYLIDRRGTIIDEFGPNYAELDLVIIDGLTTAAPVTGMLVDETRALLVARLLGELQRRPDLVARLSQVDVSDARDAVVLLKDDTVLVRLGDAQFVDRLQAYLDLAPALRERVPAIDYVDLRFEERVYVKPRPNGPRASTRPVGNKS
jgi:cell division protein FtsQ